MELPVSLKINLFEINWIVFFYVCQEYVTTLSLFHNLLLQFSQIRRM